MFFVNVKIKKIAPNPYLQMGYAIKTKWIQTVVCIFKEKTQKETNPLKRKNRKKPRSAQESEPWKDPYIQTRQWKTKKETQKEEFPKGDVKSTIISTWLVTYLRCGITKTSFFCELPQFLGDIYLNRRGRSCKRDPGAEGKFPECSTSQ